MARSPPFYQVRQPGPTLSGQFLRCTWSVLPFFFPLLKNFIVFLFHPPPPPLLLLYHTICSPRLNRLEYLSLFIFFSLVLITFNDDAFFPLLPRGKFDASSVGKIDRKTNVLVDSSPALPLLPVLPPSESPVLCPGDGTRQRVVKRRLRARSLVLTLVCIASRGVPVEEFS